MTEKAWRSHYDVKDETRKMCYYPALSRIYKYLTEFDVTGRRVMYASNSHHTFVIEGVVVVFPFKAVGAKKFCGPFGRMIN